MATIYEIAQEEYENDFVSAYWDGKDEGREEGLKEGLREGVNKGKLEIAKKMLTGGMRPEIITQYIDLPLDFIKNLK